MSVLNVSEVSYFRIPLVNIPFEEFPFQISYKYAYCRFFNTLMLTEQKQDFNILGVYDYFSNEPIADYSVLLNQEWLFGEVISFNPPLRKEGKWVSIGKQPIGSVNIRLPHFKFGKNSWFYLKDGIYYAFAGIKSTKEKVAHLEWSYVYGENSTKLRIVIELLKLESKRQNLDIALSEWELIAFKVLRSESANKKIVDEELKQIVSTILPDMLQQPIYRELSIELKGKVAE